MDFFLFISIPHKLKHSVNLQTVHHGFTLIFNKNLYFIFLTLIYYANAGHGCATWRKEMTALEIPLSFICDDAV